jgi:tetratricopeptide (TPR) repeat protein
MSRSFAIRLFIIGFLIPALLTGCSRDPNVRKQKFLESGNRYRDQGKIREAAIQYQNATQVDPRFAEAHFQLGEAYLKLGDPRHASYELSLATNLNPDNYAAHLDLANLLIRARNVDGTAIQDYLKEAKAHLDLLNEKQPPKPEVLEAWADYYVAQNNTTKAMQEMQDAIALDANRADSYLRLATLQLGANLFDQAEVNFKKAAALGPKNMSAQIFLGAFYQSRNRLPEAEQQFKKAIDVNLKDPAPRAQYAGLLLAEGRKDEAEAVLKQAKNDFPHNPDGYRMLGTFYLANSDIDKATTEFAILYGEHPKDLDVKKQYIDLLIQKSRLDEATKLNDEILKANARDIDSLIHRGQIQMRQGNGSGAVKSLQQALKNDTNSAMAHYQLGLAFDLQHNSQQAESEWRAAVSLNPNLTDAQRALSIAELRHQDYGGLAQAAQQIITNAPNSPDGYLLRAVTEMQRQSYSAAEQDMRKAAEVAPASALPYVQMGNLHELQKQYPEAIRFYQMALDKDPTSADGLQGLMNAYLAQKQPDQAIAAARTQIAKVPNSSGFYDLLGTALTQNKKDFAGADAAFHKAVDLDRNNSDALLKLAQVQAAEGSVSQALATYQQSIKDHPREISFYILAGMMYESQSNYDQARSMYQQALSIDPDNALASNNLAYLMLQQGGNVDVALNMAQKARRGMPDSPAAADTLGFAYYQKGVYQSAIDMFQESLRLNQRSGGNDDAMVHYHLAMAYQKANQPVQARQQLERVLKISPNNNDARKALSELRG